MWIFLNENERKKLFLDTDTYVASSLIYIYSTDVTNCYFFQYEVLIPPRKKCWQNAVTDVNSVI